MKLAGLGILAAFLTVFPMNRSQAAVFTADGNLGEWGVTTLTGGNTPAGGSTYAVVAPTGSTLIGFMIEDTNDSSNSYQVGPNFGGQNYDAEFLGVAVQGSQLLLGIMSGQRPDNGLDRFAPGDIVIISDDGSNVHTYGIEVGGGSGHSSTAKAKVDLSLNQNTAGSTYALNSSGDTTGVASSTNANSFATNALRKFNGSSFGTVDHPNTFQTAGTVWEPTTTEWAYDPISGGTEPPFNTYLPTQFQIAGNLNTSIGPASAYIYSRDENTYGGGAGNDEHSVIELSVNLGYFLGEITEIRWSPSCGNDIVWVRDDGFGPDLPEPASVIVWGLLAACIVGWRLRRSTV